MKLEQTSDGSYTLYVPELDEHYHSVERGTDGVTTYLYRNGIKTFSISEPPTFWR